MASGGERHAHRRLCLPFIVVRIHDAHQAEHYGNIEEPVGRTNTVTLQQIPSPNRGCQLRWPDSRLLISHVRYPARASTAARRATACEAKHCLMSASDSVHARKPTPNDPGSGETGRCRIDTLGLKSLNEPAKSRHVVSGRSPSAGPQE
jgi:hypothetical protein